MNLKEAKSLKIGEVLWDDASEMRWRVIMTDQFKNHRHDCEVIIENETGDDAHICPAYLHRFGIMR
jgi:hypothetical protein